MKLSKPMEKALIELNDRGLSSDSVNRWVSFYQLKAGNNTLYALWSRRLVEYRAGLLVDNWRLSPEGLNEARKLRVENKCQ